MTSGITFGRLWLTVWTTAVVIFVVAPLLFVVLVSFTANNYISLPTQGFSLRWYRQLLDNRDLLAAGWNSLYLAVLAACCALVLGTTAAVASARWRFALLQPLRLVVLSPLLIPAVMSGLAILVFSNQIGMQSQFLRNFVAHGALTVPYVFRTVSASLAGFDLNQELAARNLGASPLKAFMLVTLPQLGAGFGAGALFAFIISFDNVGLSIFLTGANFQTLPVALFVYASFTNDPMVASASVCMLAVSVLSIIAVERFFGLERLMKSA